MIDNLTPTKGRVLAKREEPEVMRNGIIIPDSASDRNQIATVLRIGHGVEELQVGDKILTKQFYGEGIKLNEEHFIIKEEDVIGYIRRTE